MTRKNDGFGPWQKQMSSGEAICFIAGGDPAAMMGICSPDCEDKYPEVRTYHTDIVSLALASASVDVIFYEWHVWQHRRQAGCVRQCGTHASARWAACGQSS